MSRRCFTKTVDIHLRGIDYSTSFIFPSNPLQLWAVTEHAGNSPDSKCDHAAFLFPVLVAFVLRVLCSSLAKATHSSDTELLWQNTDEGKRGAANLGL